MPPSKGGESYTVRLPRLLERSTTGARSPAATEAPRSWPIAS